jgi:hypothetical protein
MTSTEIVLLVAVIALIAWNAAQQALLQAHQRHLGAHDDSIAAHQRHLAALDAKMALRPIPPIPAATLNRFEDKIAEFDEAMVRAEQEGNSAC